MAAPLQRNKAIKLMADFSIPSIEVRDSEIKSSMFWEKIAFSIELYLVETWKESFKNWGGWEKQTFSIKNKNWYFYHKKTFTQGNYKGSSSSRRKWSKKQEEKCWIGHFFYASSNSLGCTFWFQPQMHQPSLHADFNQLHTASAWQHCTFHYLP